MNSLRKSLTIAGFMLAAFGTQMASAAIITSSIGNTTPSYNDGDTPLVFTLGQTGPAPFIGACGGDVVSNCSASWQFNYGAISDTILSASLTLGIVDHDSAATGSQLDGFSVDGNDLTASLDAMFEIAGDGLDGMYNEYTIDLSSLLTDLTDGSASVGLDLAGPGLQTCILSFACPGQTLPFISETGFNGANLIFSTLSITTQDAGPNPTIPEPGTLALFGLGVLGLGAFRRRLNKGV